MHPTRHVRVRFFALTSLVVGLVVIPSFRRPIWRDRYRIEKTARGSVLTTALKAMSCRCGRFFLVRRDVTILGADRYFAGLKKAFLRSRNVLNLELCCGVYPYVPLF